MATALGDAATDLNKLVKADEVQDFVPGAILKGKIGSVVGDDFVVECSYLEQYHFANDEVQYDRFETDCF